jgi:DNA-directed RNA polymerase subunit H (RpoH/RPB5)
MSSNSNRINKIYKSRNVLLDQLDDRDYDVSQYNDFSINEVDAMMSNSQLDMLVTHKENGKKVYVKYYFTAKQSTRQIKPQMLDDIIEDLYTIEEVLTKKDTLIVVIDDEPNDTILAKLRYLYERDQLFVIIHNIKRIQTNILKHEMVPPMRVLNKEDTDEFKKRLHIKNECIQLPEISRFDPQALVIGIRPGEICKINRSSVTALSTEYYRVCI